MTNPVRRYWIPATALNTLGWNEGDIELVQAKDFDAALARESVLEDTIGKLRLAFESRVKTIGQLLSELSVAKQRNAELSELLSECCESISRVHHFALKRRLEAALKPTE